MWNIFYEDARKAINETLFTEVVFADANLRSGTRQEQNLRAAANMFVSAIEMLCQSVVEGRREEQTMLQERFVTKLGAAAGRKLARESVMASAREERENEAYSLRRVDAALRALRPRPGVESRGGLHPRRL